jgi:hypothetical protein
MSDLKRRPGDRKRPGRVAGVDYRIKVGSDAFAAQPAKTQWTMAWRRAHMLGGHAPLSRWAKNYQGHTKTNQLTTKELLGYIKARGG